MKVALVICVTLMLCVGVALVTKTVGHHTSCRTTPGEYSDETFGLGTKTCTTKEGLW